MAAPTELRLWTIQTAARWRHAVRAGVLRAKVPDADDEWADAYAWMARRLCERGIHGREAGDGLLWAWYRCPGKKNGKPDLRESALLPRGTEGVRVCFTLPAERVVLSDFHAWHHVLDYWYLAADDADEMCFERRLEARRESFHAHKPLRSADLHEALVASWDRIFVGAGASDAAIQATFRKLPIARVESVEWFRAR